MFRKLFLALIIVQAFIATGCISQRPWSYQASNRSNQPIVMASSVAIPAFQDFRETNNSNMILMYLIPGFPLGWQNLKQPEGAQAHLNSSIWLWRPGEDLAKAAASELQASNIFKEVFYSDRRSEGELVLEAKLHKSTYKSKLLSYGLSAYGPLLWIVGFPSGHFSNVLDIEFSLVDKQKRVLWTKRYVEKGGELSWIYYLGNDFSYPEFAKRIFSQVSVDLRNELTADSN